MTKDYFKVFKLQMARQLTDLGFECKGTVPNSQKPWLRAYLFDRTEEFMEAFEVLRKEHQNG